MSLFTVSPNFCIKIEVVFQHSKYGINVTSGVFKIVRWQSLRLSKEKSILYILYFMSFEMGLFACLSFPKIATGSEPLPKLIFR